jgi:CheY-like chemotaxis protein
VLVNLVGNALKFTQEGEVAVNVENDPQEAEPGALLFSVADTGIGIPEGKLEGVFDSFTQADSSHTREYGGTGLGLAISKRLVALMGGHIWAESTVSQGSTFSFTSRFGVQLKRASQKSPGPNLKEMKVLVVDDNETNRLILTETLTSWGAAVTEVGSGTEALAELERARDQDQPYSLALLDSRMPGMAGFDVADCIRKDPALSRVTMMMLTSDRRKGDLVRCQQLGIASYLIKPIKRRDLSEAIRSILSTEEKTGDDAAVRTPHGDRRTTIDLLLADDSEDNRFLIQAYLRNSRYILDTAENGTVACQKFMTHSYDLVLMDMQMPVMDGYAATRQMRAWEKETGTSPTPIVALTAYALKEEVQKSLDAGCDTHLSKPIKKSVLLKTIEEHVAAAER